MREGKVLASRPTVLRCYPQTERFRRGWESAGSGEPRGSATKLSTTAVIAFKGDYGLSHGGR